MEKSLNKEKFLFEISDYLYISGSLTILVLCLSVFILGIFQAFGITDFQQTLMTRTSFLVMSGGGLTIMVLMKIFYAFKKRRIQFYPDKIVYTYDNTVIPIDKVEDILLFSHFISSINFGGANPKKRKIWLKKNILIRYFIGAYVFVVTFILFFIPSIIVNLIMHKKLIITSCIIPFIWEYDKTISVIYPLPKIDEQEKVEKYFKKYLNTDINKMKKNYF